MVSGPIGLGRPELRGPAASDGRRDPMSRREQDDAALEAEIGRLPDLGHDELRERWKLLFGRRAPKSLRRKFMARPVAYQMQVAANGGLSAAAKRPPHESPVSAANWDPARVRCRVPNKTPPPRDPP